MREYAARAGIIVVGIDYSLSPEAKFPVALNEVVEATRWLQLAGASHGIDPKRLAVGGDSAGQTWRSPRRSSCGRGAVQACAECFSIMARSVRNLP